MFKMSGKASITNILNRFSHPAYIRLQVIVKMTRKTVNTTCGKSVIDKILSSTGYELGIFRTWKLDRRGSNPGSMTMWLGELFPDKPLLGNTQKERDSILTLDLWVTYSLIFAGRKCGGKQCVL